MKVQIGDEIHLVDFRHTTLPYHDVRKTPTLKQMAWALEDAQDFLRRRMRQSAESCIDDALAAYYGSRHLDSHQTECVISVDGDDLAVDLAVGVALCDKQDKFTRAMGRTVSLLKAVQQLPQSTQGVYLSAFATSGMRLPPRELLLVLGAGRPWSKLADKFVDFYAKKAA